METGKIASGGGGLFLWELPDFRISYEDKFFVSCPRFTFFGVKYYIILSKEKQSYCTLSTFCRSDDLLLPPVSIEFQLRSGKESVSPIYTVTTDGLKICVSCGVDIYEYLSKKNDSFLFPFLTLSLRIEDGRTHHDLKKLQEDFKNFFLSEEDSDITLKVQGKEFPAHRIILRSRSPVFKAMFGNDMVEKISGAVTIEDCDSETFSDFLNYLYTGSTGHVREGNVCQLYTASDKYDVAGLKAACVEFMKTHLSVDLFCDFFTLIMKHSEAELIHQATEFFCAKALEITKTLKWQIFLKDNVTAGNELFVKFCDMQKNI